jgi:hypothetical protein
MNRILRVFATIALMAIARPVAAQLAVPVHVVPVVALSSGVGGSDWRTSISLSNLSEGTIDVTAAFLREDTFNIPPFVPVEFISLETGRTFTVDDVIGTWFPGQGNTKGTLVLLAELREAEEGDYAQLAAATRIYNNADPDATYGQAVVSNLLGLMIAPGRLAMTGARWDDAVRSNLGVVNLSVDGTDFIISVFSEDGTRISKVGRRVPAFSMSQWSLEQLGVPSLTTPGRVEVIIDPDSVTWDPCDVDPDEPELEGAAFFAYLSRIDQTTSDAEFQPGQSDWKPYQDLCGDEPPGIPAMDLGFLFDEVR